MGPAPSRRHNPDNHQQNYPFPDTTLQRKILDDIASDFLDDVTLFSRVDKYLSQRPSLLNKGYPDNGRGMTPLIAAVMKDRPGLVESLLRRGADVEARGICSSTALQTACLQGSTVLVRILLEHGASPRAEDINRQTSLHYAAQCTKLTAPRTVRLVAPGSDLHAVDRWGRTALHYACMGHNFDVATVLLELGSSVDVCDHSGKAPAMLVSHEGMRSEFIQSPLYQLRTFASVVVVGAPQGTVAEGGRRRRRRGQPRPEPGTEGSAGEAMPVAVPIAEPLRGAAPYSAIHVPI